MRHFPRLNRVVYGILGRRHPGVLTLLGQNRVLPARSRTACAAGLLLRVRLTQCALCLNDWLLATFDDHAAIRNRRLSKSRPARPYIWRLMVFKRLICPSTCPLLQDEPTAARTAS